jgi:hypothetical protein
MKNILLILLLILAFGGCKDDEQVEPDAVVYEDWQILPDSIIPIDEEIISINYRRGSVFIQTKKWLYTLDSTLQKSKNVRLGTESSSYMVWSPAYNDNYALFRSEYKGITIVDLSQPLNNSVTFESNDKIFGDDVFNWHYSNIVNGSEFSTVSMIREGDTVYTKLSLFHIEHTIGSQTPIQVIKDEEVTLEALEMPRNGWPISRLKVFRNSKHSISITNRDYRVFDKNTLIADHKYDFTNMFEFNGALYANGDSLTFLTSGGLESSDGLFRSNDNGKSFELIIEDTNIEYAQFKIMGNRIIIFDGRGDYRFGIHNENFSIEREINNIGLQSPLKCIEKVGNKVVVGTDAGVYYKSWESFLNK